MLAITLVALPAPVLEGDAFHLQRRRRRTTGRIRRSACSSTSLSERAPAFVSVGGRGKLQRRRERGSTCQLGTLASGAAAAFTIVVQPRAGRTLPSTAGVTAMTSDPNPGNNAAFATTTVTPAASTLVVTNTNRSGPGSLYQAIVDANDPGPRDTITFNIPGRWPAHDRANGLICRTSPSRSSSTERRSLTMPERRLSRSTARTRERRLAWSSTAPTASSAGWRSTASITWGSCSSGAGGHRLEANFIGTNAAGTGALGNNGSGREDHRRRATGSQIGGTAPGAGNVISGNSQAGGVRVDNSGHQQRKHRRGQLHRPQPDWHERWWPTAATAWQRSPPARRTTLSVARRRAPAM